MVKAKSIIGLLTTEDIKKMDIKKLISIQVMKMTETLTFYKSTNTTLKGYVESIKFSDIISEYKSNILEFNKLKKFIETL